MKFTERLRKNEDFQIVYKEGKSRGNKQFVLYIRKNGLEINRIGVSVSKKIGNSVVRHRVKRLVKESYRLCEHMFNSGLDIVIVARKGAGDLNFESTQGSLIHLFKLHNQIST